MDKQTIINRLADKGEDNEKKYLENFTKDLEFGDEVV